MVFTVTRYHVATYKYCLIGIWYNNGSDWEVEALLYACSFALIGGHRFFSFAKPKTYIK